jgi:hypothetical protein
VEKVVCLIDGGVRVRYHIENLSEESLPFLFKLHTALFIEPGDELFLPPCTIEPVDTGFSTIIGRPEKTSFPLAYDREGKEIRINYIPGPDVGDQDFFYATELTKPMCGLKSVVTSRVFSMSFDGRSMPYVWVFASYGKWRNHYVVVLEPCTNGHYDLRRAYNNGVCALLERRERREFLVDVNLRKAIAPALQPEAPLPVTMPRSTIAVRRA